MRFCLAFLLFAALGAPALGQLAPPMVAPSPSPLQQGDAFGEEITLPGATIIYLRGRGKWESAFDTLVEAFASLTQYLDARSIKASGPAMTVFTQTNDTGFEFQAAMPIATTPDDPPKGDIAVGKAPAGRALKFTHRGTYDAMDTTYEAITNYLDMKNLDAKDIFIEEYAGGPLKKGDEALLVTVYVPVK